MAYHPDIDPLSGDATTCGERRARDLMDVACWLGLRHDAPVRAVDAFALTPDGDLVVLVPAPGSAADPERLTADAATALRALGWRCPTVRVAEPAGVQPHATMHERLAGAGRVEGAVSAPPRR